jgi:hypothetical protein
MTTPTDEMLESLLTDRKPSAPLLGTESAALAISRVKYTHDAMIDLIVAKPGIHQNELAKHFGYTVPWVSRIVNSDAFQARLAVRKSDIIDPSLVLSIEERLKAVAALSLDVVLEKLEQTRNPDLAIKAMDISAKALGYGARAQNLSVQQNFVVAMPAKSASGADWITQHSPDLARLVPTQVIETMEYKNAE